MANRCLRCGARNAWSSAFRSPGSSTNCAARALSRTCSGLTALGMAITPSWRKSHAIGATAQARRAAADQHRGIARATGQWQGLCQRRQRRDCAGGRRRCAVAHGVGGYHRKGIGRAVGQAADGAGGGGWRGSARAARAGWAGSDGIAGDGAAAIVTGCCPGDGGGAIACHGAQVPGAPGAPGAPGTSLRMRWL